MPPKIITALDVANYFLAQTDPEEDGDLISNLKLQKLLYYAQGFSLVLLDDHLFEDRIEAWTHGPVVPAAYHSFKSSGRSAIPRPESLNLKKYPVEVKDLLDEVYRTYGQFSAWKLREMTHSEPPWRDARKKKGEGPVITRKSMRNYFKTLIIDDDGEGEEQEQEA